MAEEALKKPLPRIPVLQRLEGPLRSKEKGVEETIARAVGTWLRAGAAGIRRTTAEESFAAARG